MNSSANSENHGAPAEPAPVPSVPVPYATGKGTTRYRERFTHLHAEHFRQRYGLWLSSIGLGSYLPPSASAESPAGTTGASGYQAAVEAALARGCNVVDTAINYRATRSEREIGAALAALLTTDAIRRGIQRAIRRDEVVVCTKGGYLVPPQDSDDGDAEPARLVAQGLANADEIVGKHTGGEHCMAPAYLHECISRSLGHLRLDAIDVYYLHNPETQLQAVGPAEFKNRLRRAFEQLETEADAGRIRLYGVATWDGLRTQIQDRIYLPLTLLEELAREVGGEKHKFRFVQLPYNLWERAAFSGRNQPLPTPQAAGGEPAFGPLLAAAMQLGLTVLTSATLAQGRVLERLPAQFGRGLGEWESSAQAAIQFNRSTPGVTTALVGMGTVDHVVENMAVAQHAPLTREHIFRLFQRP